MLSYAVRAAFLRRAATRSFLLPRASFANRGPVESSVSSFGIGHHRTSLAFSHSHDRHVQIPLPALRGADTTFEVHSNLFPTIEKHIGILRGDNWRNQALLLSHKIMQ